MRDTVVLLTGVLLVCPALAQSPGVFAPECSVPFSKIAVEREIDHACGPAGSASKDAVKQQNIMKNNFCATGVPIDLTLRDFKELQITVDELGISHGRRGLPIERIPLATVAKIGAEWYGEGSVVRFSGFITSARYGNVREGDTVNCKLEGAANNNLEIELGERKKAGKCAQIAAVISPHYRPDEWTVDRLRLAQDEGRPIQVSGQLFFDASHDPCAGGEGYRASTWEIHPVYDVAVCRETSLGKCRKDAGLWVPLESWVPDAWTRRGQR
jgi:hypothetical protein